MNQYKSNKYMAYKENEMTTKLLNAYIDQNFIVSVALERLGFGIFSLRNVTKLNPQKLMS